MYVMADVKIHNFELHLLQYILRVKGDIFMKKFHSIRLMILSFFILIFTGVVTSSTALILGYFDYSEGFARAFLKPGVYIAMFGAVIALILFVVGFVMSFFEKQKNSDKKEEASTEKEVPNKENETGK